MGFIFYFKELSAHGANVNAAKTADGSTPLIMAAQNGHSQCVKVRIWDGENMGKIFH